MRTHPYGDLSTTSRRAEHDRTTATIYIDDNVVVCVLENILTDHETTLIDAGSSSAVIDGRVAFQTNTEDEFTAAIERLTHRRVVAFMSANQTLPGVAAELFFLDAIPPTAATYLANSRRSGDIAGRPRRLATPRLVVVAVCQPRTDGDHAPTPFIRYIFVRGLWRQFPHQARSRIV